MDFYFTLIYFNTRCCRSKPVHQSRILPWLLLFVEGGGCVITWYNRQHLHRLIQKACILWPVTIKSILKWVDRPSCHNFFRDTVPQLHDSIAKKLFSYRPLSSLEYFFSSFLEWPRVLSSVLILKGISCTVYKPFKYLYASIMSPLLRLWTRVGNWSFVLLLTTWPYHLTLCLSPVWYLSVPKLFNCKYLLTMETHREHLHCFTVVTHYSFLFTFVSFHRDFVFYHLPQLQYKNPNVQMQTFKNITPSPFIRCFLSKYSILGSGTVYEHAFIGIVCLRKRRETE